MAFKMKGSTFFNKKSPLKIGIKEILMPHLLLKGKDDKNPETKKSTKKEGGGPIDVGGLGAAGAIARK
jgi:hypothetical protein